MKEKICPICKQKYKGQPAISRKDNKTEICGNCGTTEALLEYYKFIMKGGKEN
jgi:RNA polymerase subunit RPABC4/transcription elongation factor Spt4